MPHKPSPEKKIRKKTKEETNSTTFPLPYKYPLWEADHSLQLKSEPKWLPLQLKLSSYCSSSPSQLSPLQLMESSQGNPLQHPENAWRKLYFHDIVDGKNPTVMQIIRPSNKSPGSFGTTFMVDDPLTEKPEPTSKLVGRAQGIYALASPA